MAKPRSSSHRQAPRHRFWWEAGLCSASAFLLMLTVFVPDWVEAAFGIDPDHGSGALEWTIGLLLLAVATLSGIFARAEWRRPSIALAPEPG
jgi:hypothetical protein